LRPPTTLTHTTYRTTDTTTKSRNSPATLPNLISSPSAMTHLRSRQPSPVRVVRNDMAGMTRSEDIPLMTLLNELPSIMPTVSLSMSSLNANLLYSFHSLSPRNCLSPPPNEFSIRTPPLFHYLECRSQKSRSGD